MQPRGDDSTGRDNQALTVLSPTRELRLSQDFFHRLAARKLIDQLVHVADFPHRRFLDLLHPDTANHALD